MTLPNVVPLPSKLRGLSRSGAAALALLCTWGAALAQAAEEAGHQAVEAAKGATEAVHGATEAAHGAAAAAAHGAEHGDPWMDLLYKAINVAILFTILYWAARKPVAQGLASLAKTTAEAFVSSRKSAQDMEAQMVAQKQKITALAADLARMVSDAKADVEREKQRAQADAQAQAAKIQTQTQQQIEQEVAKARATLRKELADQTVKLAEALIKKEVNPAEQKRLVAEYLKQLEARS